MADLEEIRALLYRACYANDERQADLWASCWTDDAIMTVGSRSEVAAGTAHVLEGGNTITQAMTTAWKNQTHRRRHVVTNTFLIEDGDDHAVVQSYLSLYLIKGEERPVLEVTGSYRDHVVRQRSAWKIHKRQGVLDNPYRPGDIEA